jgi:type IV secretion system protein TrbI
MELKKIPMPKGFSKQKLILLFSVLFGVFIIVLIWVTTRDPVAGSTQPVAQNYVKNDPAADVSDILSAGNKVTSTGVITTLGKVVASQPVSNLTQQDVAASQQAAQELKAAMKAPLTSNMVAPQNSAASHSGSGQSSAPTIGQDNLPKDDQNQTAEKRSFLQANGRITDNVLSTTVSKPVAALVLSMGTKIPAQLDQEINSDLPGQIYGHVSRDVYDSRTHSNLLIPAGSNLVGTYDSSLAYGQERLLVAWKRVNFPNGQWIDIQGMGGADPVGAGFGDQVDNHYWRIFGATFLTSVLAAGAQLSQPQQTNALQAPSVGQTVGQSVGTQIANTGTMLMQKNINIQPTLHIRAGFEFTVEVNKDIVFPDSYTGNKSKS